MRILHTSDWHLGRGLGPVSLVDAQAQFIDWLVGVCEAERVELVVIAGDLYDRAIPPTESVVMFRDGVRRLLGAGAKVAAITGNHDGADRVAAYGDLLDLSGFILRGGYSNFGEVIHLDAADGPLDVVLVPFLDPLAAPDEVAVEGSEVHDLTARRVERTHQSVLRAAIDAAQSAMTAPRSIAVAHAFVVGGTVTDSERQLTVGGTGTVQASVFDSFSYVALGHLHRPQEIAGRETLRYSGTPLAYSFSEDHAKSVALVDLDGRGRCHVESVPVPVGRAVCTVTGTMNQLLAHPSRETKDMFVKAVVTDQDTVLDARGRLAVVYPHIVEVRLEPIGGQLARACAPIEVRDLSPLDATLEFWLAAEGESPDTRTRAVLVDVVGAAIRRVAS